MHTKEINMFVHISTNKNCTLKTREKQISFPSLGNAHLNWLNSCDITNWDDPDMLIKFPYEKVAWKFSLRLK